MEWVRGVTLRKLFKKKLSKARTLEEKEEANTIILEILKQISSGLHSMFKKRHVHWDIKGDNLFVDLSQDPEFKDC